MTFTKEERAELRRACDAAPESDPLWIRGDKVLVLLNALDEADKRTAELEDELEKAQPFRTAALKYLRTGHDR